MDRRNFLKTAALTPFVLFAGRTFLFPNFANAQEASEFEQQLTKTLAEAGLHPDDVKFTVETLKALPLEEGQQLVLKNQYVGGDLDVEGSASDSLATVWEIKTPGQEDTYELGVDQNGRNIQINSTALEDAGINGTSLVNMVFVPMPKAIAATREYLNQDSGQTLPGNQPFDDASIYFNQGVAEVSIARYIVSNGQLFTMASVEGELGTHGGDQGHAYILATSEEAISGIDPQSYYQLTGFPLYGEGDQMYSCVVASVEMRNSSVHIGVGMTSNEVDTSAADIEG